MTPTALILSNMYDFSTDKVCLRLSERGISFLRINYEQFASCHITLDPKNPYMEILISGRCYEIGQELKSIWFRQPVFLRNVHSERLSLSEQLEISQWMAFLRSLMVFNQAVWMNFPADTYLAETKSYQLYAANKCGFKTPITRITNNYKEIRKLFPEHVVVKSLDTMLLYDGSDCLFTYTTINKTEHITDEVAANAPFIVQEVIREKIDLRITIIGKDIFSVKILSEGKGIEGDWRVIPSNNLQYEDVELPAKTAQQCLEFVNLLKLPFAAIDLIQTSTDIYFIEINPTGEWGWLDNENRKIDSSIASWLINPFVGSPIS